MSHFHYHPLILFEMNFANVSTSRFFSLQSHCNKGTGGGPVRTPGETQQRSRSSPCKSHRLWLCWWGMEDAALKGRALTGPGSQGVASVTSGSHPPRQPGGHHVGDGSGHLALPEQVHSTSASNSCVPDARHHVVSMSFIQHSRGPGGLAACHPTCVWGQWGRGLKLTWLVSG